MELIQLTSDYEIKPFDCGDAVLNGFLRNEAKPFLETRLARTFVLYDRDEDQIAGFFCLLHDPGYSMFRFLTVDAYLESVPFYERNGFRKLAPTREQGIPK